MGRRQRRKGGRRGEKEEEEKEGRGRRNREGGGGRGRGGGGVCTNKIIQFISFANCQFCLAHHDGSKAEYLSIILQHLDEVLLGWLRDQGETRLLAILQ